MRRRRRSGTSKSLGLSSQNSRQLRPLRSQMEVTLFFPLGHPLTQALTQAKRDYQARAHQGPERTVTTPVLLDFLVRGLGELLGGTQRDAVMGLFPEAEWLALSEVATAFRAGCQSPWQQQHCQAFGFLECQPTYSGLFRITVGPVFRRLGPPIFPRPLDGVVLVSLVSRVFGDVLGGARAPRSGLERRADAFLA